jgi:RNA polymerase sigma factor (TIGR02999 family)
MFVLMSDVTRILSAIEQGDPSAADQLLPLVYEELRALAAARLAQEKPGQTLEATALVHEAYLRLVASPGRESGESAQHWNSRGHFFAAAAEAMRRILIDNARRKGRQKRGGARRQRVDLDSPDLVSQTTPDELLLLDDALAALSAEEPETGQLVKLRYFAGLSVEQAAQLLGLSRTTAYEHWAYARVWLHAELYGRREPS